MPSLEMCQSPELGCRSNVCNSFVFASDCSGFFSMKYLKVWIKVMQNPFL